MSKAQKRNFIQNTGLLNVIGTQAPVVKKGSSVNTLLGVMQFEQNQRNQLEKEYRDGIVQGKFAPDMAADVESMLLELSKIGNSNSREYKSKLSVANARLLSDVGKQTRITDYTSKVETNFESDPDNKFYRKNNIFGEVNAASDNVYDAKGNIKKRGLDTELNDIQNVYNKSLKNVNNINADVVVEDFGTKLGKISSEWQSANVDVDGNLLTETKTGGGTVRKSGYKYDTSLGYSVPVFENADDVPQDWVEKFYTGNKASAALMDDYVAKNAKRFGSGPDAEMKAKKEFMLENVLQKLIPDYVGKSDKDVDISATPGSGSGSGASTANAELVITTLGKAFKRDESIVDANTPTDIISTANIENSNFGEEVDDVNVYNITSSVSNIPFGVGPTGKAKYADNVYVLPDPFGEGENTTSIIVELDGKKKLYEAKDFTELITSISQNKMDDFELGDVRKTKFWDNDTDKFDLSKIAVENVLDPITQDEAFNLYNQNTNTNLNKNLDKFLETENGLDDLSLTDINKNDERNRNVDKALKNSLIGRRIGTKRQQVSDVEVERNSFQENHIVIKYEDGTQERLQMDAFKLKFQNIDDL